MTQGRREQLRRDFETGQLKKVIATTVWKVGVSFQQLSELVWAAGGSSAIDSTQGPGRVSRIHGASGKQVGIVRDFSDDFDSGFNNQWHGRRRIYARQGWAIFSADDVRVT
jgi:hypothetical protein